jgi:multidrug efflux pump subunit AcrA (membrane-fusion protein)
MRTEKALTIAMADAALASLESKESQLANLLAQAGTRLAEAEAGAGERFLDGAEDPMREVIDLRLQIDTLNAALAALERRKSEAKLARRRAEAADARRQVKLKRGDLATLEGQTGKLLAELSRLEGIEYSAGILSSQPTGIWNGADFHSEPKPWEPAHRLKQDPAGRGGYAAPRSGKLRQEIEDLEKQARIIEGELGEAASD